MSLVDERPYAGSWSQDILNKYRKITTWTPDAIVLFNGDTKVAGCNECKNKIDFMGFITSAQVSAGVNAGDLTCSIEMSIPGHFGDSIFKDGEFILSLGIEVNVYYRGFFEVDGLDPKETTYTNDATGEEFDLNKVKMRPYYPVFHGVTVSSSYSFSGGFYSLSLSCNSLLHFWSNQKVVTNAAYLAAKPSGSRGSVRLDGHVYTNMTPFQIIYDLYRDSGGSADGLEWVFSSSSNQTAEAETGESLFSLALRYWETRFSQGLYGLRMYGASGTLYTQLQTAYLGDPSRTTSGVIKTIQKDGVLRPTDRGKKSTNAVNKSWILNLIDRQSNLKHARLTPDLLNLVELDDKGRAGYGLLVTEMKAFITDLGAIGQFDLFSTQYESKQSIAETVAEKVGFEFYQDLDGDLVFKPPFYNLNVKGNRVYTIKREDVIDISFENQEPEYTYATCKGSMFRNTAGLGMEGTWGVKGTYVDYRLVAKYGWKALEFDTTFFNTARSAFFAAVVDLERKNVNVNGCSVTIPMRPELKPGYPVYIEYIDCFYYVNSIQHSFSFGGDCTTSLTLTARRKKFLPPGHPNVPGVEGVDLSNPLLPPKSLIQEVESGLYKTIGFPNVVMALDPSKPSPYLLARGLEKVGGIKEPKRSKDRAMFRNGLLLQAQELGVLKLDPSSRSKEFLEGPWVLTTQDGQKKRLKVNGGTLKGEEALSQAVKEQEEGRKRSDAFRRRGKTNAKEIAQEVEDNYQRALENIRASESDDFATIVDLVDSIRAASPAASGSETVSLLDALSDKRTSFNPNLPGFYRYYSSSHPDKKHQAPDGYNRVLEGEELSELQLLDAEIIDATQHTKITTIRGNLVSVEEVPIESVAGIKTRTKRSRGAEYVPTKDILHLSFQQHGSTKKVPIKKTDNSKVSLTYSALKSLAVSTFNSKLTKTLGSLKGKTIEAGALNSKFFFRSKGSSEIKFTQLTATSDLSALTGAVDINTQSADIITHSTTAFTAQLEASTGNLRVADLAGKKAEIGDIDYVNKNLKLLIGSSFKVRGRTVINTGKFREVQGKYNFKSPIFPVSDEEGYEVFGSYQYGRGLNLAEGGGFDQLLRQDPSRVLNDAESDEFLTQLFKNGGVTREEAFLAVAEKVSGRIREDAELSDLYFRLSGRDFSNPSNKAESLKELANALMTNSKDQVVENAPIRLSDIRPKSGSNDTACDCRGDTSDIEMYLLEVGVEIPSGKTLSDTVNDSEIVHISKQVHIDSKVSEWNRRQLRLTGVPQEDLPHPQHVSNPVLSEGALQDAASAPTASEQVVIAPFVGPPSQGEVKQVQARRPRPAPSDSSSTAQDHAQSPPSTEDIENTEEELQVLEAAQQSVEEDRIDVVAANFEDNGYEPEPEEVPRLIAYYKEEYNKLDQAGKLAMGARRNELIAKGNLSEQERRELTIIQWSLT